MGRDSTEAGIAEPIIYPHLDGFERALRTARYERERREQRTDRT